MLKTSSTCSLKVSSALQVVAQPTPWNGGLAAISNFGFGGTNVHCIVEGKVGDPKLLPAAEEAPTPKVGSEVCPPKSNVNVMWIKQFNGVGWTPVHPLHGCAALCVLPQLRTIIDCMWKGVIRVSHTKSETLLFLCSC